MMIYAGILSIFQMGFLPGFLLVKFLRLSDGMLKTLVLSLASSVLINHLMVNLLVILHCYTASVVWVIVALEVLCILLLFLRDRSSCLNRPLATDVGSFLALFMPKDQVSRSEVSKYEIPIFLSFYVFILYILIVIDNIGSVFTTWDAVVSWNPWAVSWAKGEIPKQTWHYPQAVPCVWSLGYLLMGDVRPHFFAKWLMSLFPLCILLCQFDLGLRLRDPRYLWGAAVTGMVFYALWGPSALSSGVVDVPVAFMGFCPFYLILLAREERGNSSNSRNMVYLGAFLAVGAFLTKQAGVFIAVLYPVFVYLMLYANGGGASRGSKRVVLLWSCVIILAVGMPWYVYKEIQIQKGLATTEAVYVMFGAVHEGRNYLQRLLHSFAVLSVKPLGAPLVILGFCGLAMSLRDKLWRWVTLLLIIPFSIAWALFFSYSQRNLALAIPYSGIAIAVGMTHLLPIGASRWFRKMLILALAVSVLFAGWWVGERYGTDRMLKRQEYRENQTGDAVLNAYIHDFMQFAKSKKKVLTNCGYMGVIPSLREFIITSHLDTTDVIQKDLNDPKVGYLLYYNYSKDERILRLLKEMTMSGQLILIRTTNAYSFYEKRQPAR